VAGAKRLTNITHNALAGFIAVTLLYLFSMRGLTKIVQRYSGELAAPLRLLEIGVTLLYIAAAIFFLLLHKKPRHEPE
jgi:hypothetical protein